MSLYSRLTRQDLWWFVDQNFKVLDVNHDGILELSEYDTVMKQDDVNRNYNITLLSILFVPPGMRLSPIITDRFDLLNELRIIHT